MSKTVLTKILEKVETPVPRLLLVTDCAEVCGRGILYSLTKSHLRTGSHVLYLTTVMSPYRIKSFINGDEYPGKAKYCDGFSDPCSWEKKEDCIRLSEPLDEIYWKEAISGNEKGVLIVDKLDNLLNHQDSLALTRSLHKLASDDRIEQLIVYCGRDCITESVMSALCYIASGIIHMHPATPCQCKIILKKPSGKVIQSFEEFSLDKDLKVQYNRPVVKDKKNTEAKTSDEDAILAAQTTFNLSLTPNQRESKNKLLLPHTRVQSSGGQIHYTPDDVDDWDDEDPDDDLDI